MNQLSSLVAIKFMSANFVALGVASVIAVGLTCLERKDLNALILFISKRTQAENNTKNCCYC